MVVFWGRWPTGVHCASIFGISLSPNFVFCFCYLCFEFVYLCTFAFLYSCIFVFLSGAQGVQGFSGSLWIPRQCKYLFPIHLCIQCGCAHHHDDHCWFKVFLREKILSSLMFEACKYPVFYPHLCIQWARAPLKW